MTTNQALELLESSKRTEKQDFMELLDMLKKGHIPGWGRQRTKLERKEKPTRESYRVPKEAWDSGVEYELGTEVGNILDFFKPLGFPLWTNSYPNKRSYCPRLYRAHKHGKSS